MFQAGDMVIYGRTGVCRVEGVLRQNGREYYELIPVYQKCNIRTPVDGKVFMRAIITKEEAEALIDLIPTLQVSIYDNRALRELTEHYAATIATHECQALVELIMSIYKKKERAEKEKRKFGAVDERFMREGEALLHGELAVALDIPVEEVPRYISHRVALAQAGR